MRAGEYSSVPQAYAVQSVDTIVQMIREEIDMILTGTRGRSLDDVESGMLGEAKYLLDKITGGEE